MLVLQVIGLYTSNILCILFLIEYKAFNPEKKMYKFAQGPCLLVVSSWIYLKYCSLYVKQ